MPTITQALRPIANMTSRVYETANAMDSPDGRPLPGSPGADAFSFAAPVGVEQWHALMHSSLTVIRARKFAAVDFLASIGAVLNAKVGSPFAHLVLARSCLDISARALWLLEPTVAADVRVKRYELDRMHRVEQLKRSPISELKGHGRDQWPEIKADCEALGWEVKRASKTGPDEVDGETCPSPSALIGGLLDDASIFGRDDIGLGRPLWWYMSGIVHGGTDDLLRAVADQPEPSGAALPAGTERRAFVYRPDRVRLVVLTVASAVVRLLDDWTVFMGLPLEQVNALKAVIGDAADESEALLTAASSRRPESRRVQK